IILWGSHKRKENVPEKGKDKIEGNDKANVIEARGDFGIGCDKGTHEVDLGYNVAVTMDDETIIVGVEGKVIETEEVDKSSDVDINDVSKNVNEEKSNDNVNKTSYASKLIDNLNTKDNKLFFVPIAMNKNGDEAILFEEEFVREGSKKRMWGKNGLKDIVVDTDEMCYFKFKNDEGMNFVIDQSPWLYCKMNPKVIVDTDKRGNDQNKNGGGYREDFMEVRNRKHIGGQKGLGNNGVQGNKQATRKDVGNVSVKYAYKPKAPDPNLW
ncbi:hypothetical protein Tco_0546111, partial [Tanacetum coccineum]